MRFVEKHLLDHSVMVQPDHRNSSNWIITIEVESGDIKRNEVKVRIIKVIP
ncbi:hypothetical protein [Alkalihalobacillus sp. BA299]|uniref:hypothetical protein n=1 Tax=Alkalihalobacillus sp. BA299 TaxID=2815938 RepID=UPI001AD993C5|nr:hypothetical protein [Alkalihalobacillus sp. BA299]